jgi:hypothetical protein
LAIEIAECGLSVRMDDFSERSINNRQSPISIRNRQSQSTIANLNRQSTIAKSAITTLHSAIDLVHFGSA